MHAPNRSNFASSLSLWRAGLMLSFVFVAQFSFAADGSESQPDLRFGFAESSQVSFTAEKAEYSVSFEVANGGLVSSAATSVQVFISPEPGSTLPEQRVGTAQIPALEPGATSARLSLAAFLEPGAPPTNYLTAMIDTEGSIEESDDTNNQRVWQIFGPGPVPDRPDWVFAVSKLTRRTAKPGGEVTAVVRLANLGKVEPGPGMVRVGCYLHPVGADPSTGTRFAEFSLETLESGKEWRFGCTIPPNQPLGPYECTMRIDPDDAVLEAVETNNETTFPFEVTGADNYPNLFAWLVSPASFGMAGDVVTSVLDVQCYGFPDPCPAPSSTVRAYLESGSASILLVEAAVPAFDTNGYKYIPVKWTVPMDVPPGQYTVVCRTDEEDYVTEYSETNVTRGSFHIFAGPIAELELSYIASEPFEQTVVPGGSAFLQFKVVNSGSAPAPATKLWLYFATNPFDPAPISPIKEIDVPPVPAHGETESMRVEAQMPLESAPGVYLLVAIADGPNGVPEMDETTNNRHLGLVKVMPRPLPDLVVEGWVAPHPFGSNEFTLHYTVRNDGIAASPENEIFVYLRKEGDLDSPRVAMIELPALAAGASLADQVFRLSPPAGLYAGRYRMQAVADGPGAIEEVREDNNTRLTAWVDLTGPLHNNTSVVIDFQASLRARYFTIDIPEGQRHLTVQCGTNTVALLLRDSSGQYYSTNGAIWIENPMAGVWSIQVTSSLPHRDVTIAAAFAPPHGADSGSGLAVGSPLIGAPLGAGVSAAASDGTQFVAAWVTGAGTSWSLVARRFDANGEGSANLLPVAQSAEALTGPLLASNGRNYLAVWQQGGASTRVYGAIIDPASFTASAPFVVSELSPKRLQISVASDGSDYLVAWFDGPAVYNDYVSSYSFGSVRAARITSAGTVAHPNGFVVFESPSQEILRGRKSLGLAAAAGRYLLAWEEDWHMAEGGLYGALLAGDGTVVRPAFLIAGANNWQGNAGVTAMGNHFLAYWSVSAENVNRSRHVKFALRLDSAGGALDPAPRRINSNYDGDLHEVRVLDGAPVIFFAAGDRLMARAGTADLDFAAVPAEVTSAVFGPFSFAASGRRALVCWPSGVASVRPSGVDPIILPTITPSLSTIAIPGAGAATLVDSAMRFVTAEQASLAGALLTVTPAGSLASQISLAVASSNVGGTPVSLNGPTVIVNGQAVAEFSGGTGGAPLEVRFQAGATAAAVQSVFRALACTVSAPLIEMARSTYWQQVGSHIPAKLTFRFQTGDGAMVDPFELEVAVRPAVIDFPEVVVRSGTSFPQEIYSFVVSGTVPMNWLWRLNGGRVVQSFTNLFGGSPAGGSADVYGGYTVIVANSAGRTEVGPIAYLPGAPVLQGSDGFAGRAALTGPSGSIRGDNLGMSLESGEPAHAGKAGGASAWFTWTAPGNGIATFDTRNSAFDTLLAVYKGAGLNNLQPIASNDDGAESLNSQVQFNAEAGVAYSVAIDGFSGAQNHFVLNWSFESTGDPVPSISTHPVSLSVPIGNPASFSVAAEGEGLQYQWFRNGIAIEGATAATFAIPSVQAADIGRHTVHVIMRSRVVRSDPAFLEAGSNSAAALSHDKLEDLLARVGTQQAFGLRAQALGSGGLSVSPESSGSKLLSNRDSTVQLGEPLHCGNVGGASQWLALRPTTDGTLRLDTLGSSIDTIIAVYTGTSLANLELVAADDNGASDGQRSSLQFTVSAGQVYLAAIDGAGGARGSIQVNWLLSGSASGQSPSLAPMADIVIAMDSGASEIAVEISDPDTPLGELTVSASSDNQALIPSANLSLSGAGASRRLELRPAPQASGSARISVQVSDGSSSATRTFTVTVVAVQPTLVVSPIADRAIEEDSASGPIPFWVQAFAPLAGELTLAVSSDNPNVVPDANVLVEFANNQGTLNMAPLAHRSGVARITISASDGTMTARSSFNLTVTPVADPPTLAIETAVPLIVSSRSPGTEVGIVIGDPDTPLDELFLTATSDNPALFPDANLAFSRSGPSRLLSLRSAPSASGTARISVRVSDGALSAAENFVVTVVEPELTISPIEDQTTEEDRAAESIRFTVTSSLPIQGGLTFLTSSGNHDLVSDANIRVAFTDGHGSLSITPAPERSGLARITFAVSDGTMTALSSFNLSVAPVNDPPALALNPGDSIALGSEMSAEIRIEINDPDTPLAELVVTATSDAQELIPDANLALSGSGTSRLLQIRPASFASGIAKVRVQASDGSLTATQFLAVVVLEAESELVLSPIPDQTVEEDRIAGPIPFSVSSSPRPVENLSFLVTSGNTALVADTNIHLSHTHGLGSLTITPLAQQSGVARITLLASDGNIAVRQSFDLTVAPVNDPPALEFTAASPLVLKGATTRVPLKLSDIDDSPESLSLALGFSNSRVIGREHASVEGTGADRELVLNHANSEAGSGSVLITVVDPHGANSSRILKVQKAAQPRIGLAARRTGASIAISWPSVERAIYQLQFKSGLGESWSNEGEPVRAAGAMSELAVEMSASPCVFFRVVLLE